MRRLLGAMRSDDDLALAPQSGLGNLAALSEQVGKAGLPVRVRRGQASADAHGLDFSAYRIVQEGLANALKHGHATAADVTVRYGSMSSTSRFATMASAPCRTTTRATGSSESASA